MELAVWTEDPNKEPGNFGDPLGLGQYDEDSLGGWSKQCRMSGRAMSFLAQEMRNKEINNGRFAMFSALSIVAANLLTGKDAIQQFGA